jgi:hypothetical protein
VVDRFKTNFVDTFRTNVTTLHLTNDVLVNVTRTNHVDAYRTNLQTVVVVQTNWVTQKATNIVQVDAVKPAPPTAHTQPSNSPTDEPVIEVSRTSKPPENNVVEVELKVRWPADTADAPPVAQWRIESEHGSVLSFGTDQEFRKDLPVGTYKVEAKLQRDADSPAFVLRGTLTVTIRDAMVQQRTNRTKLAAN